MDRGDDRDWDFGGEGGSGGADAGEDDAAGSGEARTVPEGFRIVGAQTARQATGEASDEEWARWSRAGEDEASGSPTGGAGGGGRASAGDLPHWTDPPTGQVPAIFDRGDGADEAWRIAGDTGPVWREEGREWDDALDHSALADDEARLGALGEAPIEERRPWEFDDLTDPAGIPVPSGSAPTTLVGSFGNGGGDQDDDDRWASWADAGGAGAAGPGRLPDEERGTGEDADEEPARPSVRTISSSPLRRGAGGALPAAEVPPPARAARRRGRAGTGVLSRPHDQGGAGGDRGEAPSAGDAGAAGGAGRPDRRAAPDMGRDLPLAVAIGSGLAALFVLLAWAGPLASMVFATVVVTLATLEIYAVLRRAGRRPATLVGVVATLGLMIAAYTKGPAAIPLVVVLVVAASFVWYLAGVERGSAVAGVGSTLLGFAWVGVFGSYAALLLAPGQFPDRHGVAFFVMVVVVTVLDDIGALFIGRWLGSHHFAPNVSAKKTWEGLVGGGVLAVVGSVVLGSLLHPWTPGKAALLGVMVAVLAPVGDLCESMVKRELGLKDTGTMLPGHGGLLDRFDALVFVLPFAYYLVRLIHLG